MKLRFALMIALAVLTTMPVGLAQDGDRDRPRRDRDRGGDRGDRGDRPGPGGPGFGRGGGFGGFFGGGPGGLGAGGATQLLGLLRIEEVRKEVGLTEDAYRAIEEQQQATFERFRELRNATEDERTKIFEEMNTAAQDLLDEALPPEKQKRLLGLFAQQAGGAAVLNPLVSKELALSEETTQAIQDELRAFGEKMRERFMAAREGGDPPNFDLQKERDDLTKLIESKLNDEQKTALDAIRGEKFEFPEFGFGGPGMGRGSRGPDGPRGDGPRGGGRRGGDRRF